MGEMLLEEAVLIREVDERFAELRRYCAEDEEDEPMDEAAANFARNFIVARQWKSRPAITVDGAGNVGVTTHGKPREVYRFFGNGEVWHLTSGREVVQTTAACLTPPQTPEHPND